MAKEEDLKIPLALTKEEYDYIINKRNQAAKKIAEVKANIESYPTVKQFFKGLGIDKYDVLDERDNFTLYYRVSKSRDYNSSPWEHYLHSSRSKAAAFPAKSMMFGVTKMNKHLLPTHGNDDKYYLRGTIYIVKNRVVDVEFRTFAWGNNHMNVGYVRLNTDDIYYDSDAYPTPVELHEEFKKTFKQCVQDSLTHNLRELDYRINKCQEDLSEGTDLKKKLLKLQTIIGEAQPVVDAAKADTES